VKLESSEAIGMAVTVSEDYHIRIPSEVCARLGIEPGDELGFLPVGSSVRIVKVRSLEELQDKLEGMDTSGLREKEDRL
jgi:bifunctional DNA-binding transcriptional regulator/antitoxin component of YhaV-PrlF toxin-antitoxin module